MRPHYVPGGSYPTPFLGRLLFKISDPKHKTRYPKTGVGYEPLGRMWVYGRILSLSWRASCPPPLATSAKESIGDGA